MNYSVKSFNFLIQSGLHPPASLFMTSKERCNLCIIYAWIMHRWIVNCWIVYLELAQHASFLKIILIKPGTIWSLKFKKKKKCWNCEITYANIIPKKAYHERTHFFGQKNYGKVVLNWRNNDQIMPRFGGSFINDKCIFQ